MAKIRYCIYIITTYSIAFSVITIFIPWSVILHWIGHGIRISLLLALGPWMILVDSFIGSKRNREKGEEALDTVRDKVY